MIAFIISGIVLTVFFIIINNSIALGVYDQCINNYNSIKFKISQILSGIVILCFTNASYYVIINMQGDLANLASAELKHFSKLPRLTMEEKKFIDNLEKKYSVEVELMLKNK